MLKPVHQRTTNGALRRLFREPIHRSLPADIKRLTGREKRTPKSEDREALVAALDADGCPFPRVLADELLRDKPNVAARIIKWSRDDAA